MATNNFSLNNIPTQNSTNIIAKSGVGAHGATRVVQKIVNVGGKQVILTGSAGNLNNDLKRHSFESISGGLSPRKILCNNIDASSSRQVVSILPSTAQTSLHRTSSAIKTQATSSVNINASSTSVQPGMPGSNSIINSKTISFATNSLGGGDGKSQSIAQSPQKVMIKGQPVTINYNQHNVILQQLNSQKSLGNSVGNAGNVQPISVAGNKLQYVRVVNSQAQNSGHAGPKVGNAVQSMTQRSIAPALTMSSSTVASKVPIMPHAQANKSSHQVTPQRLILPATSQVSIRPSISSGQSQAQQQNQSASSSHSAPLGAQALTQLPPGTTIISSGQNLQGVQGFALVPAQYVTQLQQQFNTQQQQQSQPQPALQHVSSQQSHHSYSVSRQESYSSEPRPPSAHSQKNSVSNDGAAVRTRKPCNCTKSQCLKLYCECFANGEFCSGCNCNNCYNNLDHEEERARAIKQCLDRNPNAFRPKIGKDRTTAGSRRHNKGCNCKRSGCLKNYCECYEAKILCSHLCKCVGCKNFEESPEKKTLMHLADAAEVRVQQQTAAKTKLSSQIEEVPPRVPPPTTGERLPYSFVTTEVAEATCSCLIAQLEEAERTRQIELIQEKLILEEFGRCLMQVIESSNRTKESGPV